MKTLCAFVFSCRSGAPSRTSGGSSNADLACARALAFPATLEFDRDRTWQGLELQTLAPYFFSLLRIISHSTCGYDAVHGILTFPSRQFAGAVISPSVVSLLLGLVRYRW